MKAPKGRRPSRPAGPQAPPSSLGHSTTAWPLGIAALLTLATLAVYAQTAGHEFISFDDNLYVSDNPIVKSGISASNLMWSLTTFSASNWHPLTWISLMLDSQVFGAVPGPMHLVNVALHLASTLLLFFALLRMTKHTWRAALVAGIFALHPLHVESVAWIAERKDVLSTFFEMLALLFYVRYCENVSRKRYVETTLAFALSLLSKPMAVTFPFLLLLLDYWPLHRMKLPAERSSLWPLVREKLPWFAMAAVGSALTFAAQFQAGSVASLNNVGLPARAANAAVAYAAYLVKAAVPIDLAVLYPYHAPPPAEVVGALAMLAVLTWAALRFTREYPYMTVGWLWYLGSLVPVIGLVQVGHQSMADRYTYLPLIGVTMALVWAAGDAIERWPASKNAAAVTAALVLVTLGALSYRQVQYWKNGTTLYTHTLAITRDNYTIENNLATIMANEGKTVEAIALYRQAIAADPDSFDAQANLGRNLMKQGNFAEAYSHLSAAVEIKPDGLSAHEDLGVYWVAQGNYQESSRQFLEAIRLGSTDPLTQSNLCFDLQHLGRTGEAIAHCREALRLNPALSDAHFNLGTALADQGQRAKAIAEFNRVLEIDPTHAGARAALAALSAPMAARSGTGPR